MGLDGGFFNQVNSTTIQAYDSMGNVLGSITNSKTGIEFYGLMDSSGLNVIQGISFFITGPEPFGFNIDNVTFGAGGGGGGIVPLPAGVFLLGSLWLDWVCRGKKFPKSKAITILNGTKKGMPGRHPFLFSVPSMHSSLEVRVLYQT